MSEYIEILIDAKGNIVAETKGYTGSDCQAATEFLQKTLGQVTGQRLTAEYFAQPAGQKLSTEQRS